jgi:hypothetical protein
MWQGAGSRWPGPGFVKPARPLPAQLQKGNPLGQSWGIGRRVQSQPEDDGEGAFRTKSRAGWAAVSRQFGRSRSLPVVCGRSSIGPK